jgi:hypothetical protein
MISPRKLVESLRRQGLRCRVGVLGLPTQCLGAEVQIAAALGLEYLDYRERLLASIPLGSKFLNITVESLFEDLDRVANLATGESCVLVGNFDLALLRLGTEDRTTLWRTLLTSFPNKSRALVLCVPNYEEGLFLFPDAEMKQVWQGSERYANWIDSREDGHQLC